MRFTSVQFQGGNMATTNRTPQEEQKFKQIENDSWSGIYLPAICAGVVMTIVLFMAVSCSKKSDTTTKISAPVAPAIQSPAPTTASAAVPEMPKKAVKKHRPTTATYVNGNYGVALTYPRKYRLQSGDKLKEGPLQTGLSKPGAVEIASLDMPDGVYPETDFSSALLNVSIHQGLNEEQCGQFAAQSNDAAVIKTTDADQTTKSADRSKPSATNLSANQFTEIEQSPGAGNRQY